MVKNKRKQSLHTVEHDAEYNWIANWLDKRKNLLGSNYADGKLIPVITDLVGIKNIADYGNDERNRQLASLNQRVEYSPDGSYFNKPNETVREDVIPNIEWSETNPRNKNQISLENLYDYNRYIGTLGQTMRNNNNIHYFTKNKNKSTIVHERTHALTSNKAIVKPQERVIGRHFNDNSLLNKEERRDYYLDSAPEIYSRLMEFRYNNNLSPTKKVTKSDIKNYRQNNDNVENFINRYNDDFLLYLFNEVAQNNNKRSLENAGKFDKLYNLA